MPQDVQALRVALVYDRVNTPFGGAERVLLSLHSLFPQAPLFTSLYDAQSAQWSTVFDVRTSFLQHIPFAKTKHRELLALMPLAFSRLDLSEYDIVISVTSAEAKGVKVGKNTLHISYLLTPPRYLWSHTFEYQTGILKPLRAYVFSHMRRWDFHISQDIEAVIPISQLVKKRAEKYYRRKIENVIYPPFSPSVQRLETRDFHQIKNYYLFVARLVGYKKVDLVISTCVSLKKQLVLIGDGPESQQIAKHIEQLDPEHHFIHWFKAVSDQELSVAYSAAKALIQPSEEDFGITVLESQACGTPVIVHKRSGSAETIVPNQTGVLLDRDTLPDLSNAIEQIEQGNWNSNVIQSHVGQYNDEAFQSKFRQTVDHLWKEHQKKLKGSYEQS